MKLLRLCAYFPPEKTSSSHLLDDIYRAYAKAEIDCICITPEPSRGVSDKVRREYKNKRVELLYDGYVTVKRFPMMKEGRNPIGRALRYFLCAIKTYKNALKENDIDTIFVTSTPPIMGALGSKVGMKLSKKYRRKVPVIFNLQDIFPDSLVSAGFTKKNSLLWKIGRKIENYTYNSVDEIIVISEGFKRNLMEKGVDESKITVIPNWIDIDSVYPIEKEKNKLFEEFNLSRNKFTVVYAGNFGEIQGAEIILKVATLLKKYNDIQFVMFGAGSHFEDAKNKAKEMKNVTINELLPLDRVSEVYSIGDVAIITCKPGAGSSAMPSKFWSIMACNTPVIASFDIDSDLADAIKQAGAGSCVKAGDTGDLADAILKSYDSWKNEDINMAGLREYVSHHANKDICIGKYIEIIKKSIKK